MDEVDGGNFGAGWYLCGSKGEGPRDEAADLW